MGDGAQAPPGWYPDPENPSAQRYWDGRAWAAPAAPPPPLYPPSAYVIQKQSTNGFAIASMVLGILWIYWVGSVLALVFGYIAKRQIRASGGREGGGGMATAGIVLGWIGVAAAVLVIVLIVVVSSSTTNATNDQCAATRDSARTASAVFFADTRTFPTSFTQLTNRNLLLVPSDATVLGQTVTANGWALTMSGGGPSPNTFVCTG